MLIPQTWTVKPLLPHAHTIECDTTSSFHYMVKMKALPGPHKLKSRTRANIGKREIPGNKGLTRDAPRDPTQFLQAAIGPEWKAAS